MNIAGKNHQNTLTLNARRFKWLLCFSWLTLIASCGGGGGGGGPTPAPKKVDDVTPNAFSFVDQTDVALSAVIGSNAIIVAGIDAATPISVTDGEYSIEQGAFTSTNGTVTNGQSVVVRQTASAMNSTTTDSTLTIGGVSDTFSVTTLADTTATQVKITFPPGQSMSEGV